MFEELTLTTPSILFSAVSLIMLAYTNRFLAYAQVIRNLKAEHDKNPTPMTQRQIDNLRRRLRLSRAMQIFGLVSLLLCVLCTFLIYVGMQTAALYTFALALVLLVISLWISIREVVISVQALDVYLDHMKPAAPERSFGRPTPGSVADTPSRRSRSRSGNASRSSNANPAGSAAPAGLTPPRPRATYTDASSLGGGASGEATKTQGTRGRGGEGSRSGGGNASGGSSEGSSEGASRSRSRSRGGRSRSRSGGASGNASGEAKTGSESSGNESPAAPAPAPVPSGNSGDGNA